MAKLLLLFDRFSLRFKAVCVAVLIGLSISLVLSTFCNPKLVLAPKTVVALVPPFSIGTTPVTFSALFAANAKGTELKGWLLISKKLVHCPLLSKATFKLFKVTLQ